MSDESSPPDSADRSARTIWDQYELIRGWIGILFLIPVLLSAIPLIGAFMGVFMQGVKIFPEVFVVPLVVHPLLLKSLSLVSFSLSQGMLGTGTRALAVAYQSVDLNANTYI